MTVSVIHYPNGRGGTLCLSMTLEPNLTESRDKVTCAKCRVRLDYKRRTPGQLSRVGRRGGLRSAQLPTVQQKFGGKLLSRD